MRARRSLIPNLLMSVYNKVRASATRAVGEFPSSNNLRLQNLVESQLEITKTESCLIALNAKFALKKFSFVPLTQNSLYTPSKVGLSFSLPALKPS